MRSWGGTTVKRYVMWLNTSSRTSRFSKGMMPMNSNPLQHFVKCCLAPSWMFCNVWAFLDKQVLPVICCGHTDSVVLLSNFVRYLGCRGVFFAAWRTTKNPQIFFAGFSLATRVRGLENQWTNPVGRSSPLGFFRSGFFIHPEWRAQLRERWIMNEVYNYLIVVSTGR